MSLKSDMFALTQVTYHALVILLTRMLHSSSCLLAVQHKRIGYQFFKIVLEHKSQAHINNETL